MGAESVFRRMIMATEKILTLQQKCHSVTELEDITPEEDKKLRLFAKLLVDKFYEDVHNGKVGNNG